jgi:hypothetical protein
MGVTLFVDFAEDAAGTVFAASEYGAIYHFNGSLWIKEPVQPYAVLGLPGMAADSNGNVWIAAWFDLHRWDGETWSIIDLPYSDYFFDLGGINAMAIGPDDVMWLGTNEGVVRYDGDAFTLFDTGNSALPYPMIFGIDVRDDGAIGLSCTTMGGQGAGVFIDGPFEDAGSWSALHYGSGPLPHWQVSWVGFDPAGDLWVSALSEGALVMRTGPVGPDADLDGDGDVDGADLGVLLGSWGPCGGCPADLNGDGVVDGADLGQLLGAWTG